MIQKLQLLLLFIFFHLIVVAQTEQKLDSLIKVSNGYKPLDSVKMRMLLRVYGQMIYTSSDSILAKKYLDSAKIIAIQLPNRDNIKKFYLRAGVFHHGKGEFLQALNYYNQGVNLVAKEGDRSLEAGYYMSMSDIYHNLTDYASVIDVCEKAIKIYSELNNANGLASIYNNLSGTYIILKDFITAYSYASKALPLFEADDKNSRGVASIKLVIANILLLADEQSIKKIGFIGNQRFLRVVQLMNEAQPIAIAEQDFGLESEMLLAKAFAYEQLNNTEAANSLFKLAVKKAKQGQDLNSLTKAYAAAGKHFISKNQSTIGLAYLHQALAMSANTGKLEVESAVSAVLSSYYEQKQRFDSSLFYYQRFTKVSNQIFNKEKENEITRKKLMLDFSIKEKDFVLQQAKTNQQLTEKKLELDFKNKLSWMMGILTIIVLTTAVFIYRSRKKTLALNATIEAQRHSLAELVQVKDKIFSIITHDMRSPINSLISFVYLLGQDEVSKDKLALYAKELGISLRDTSALMENLLNWASSQLQGFETKITSVLVHPIISNLIVSNSNILQQKNIQVQHIVPTNAAVLADKNMLELVLRNLISNALKFSYPGTVVQISITLSSDQTFISIADQGVGMTDAMIENINGESTYSLNSTLGTSKEKGTGLGLILCKSFLQLMGGKLIAEANQPKGTRIMIALPTGDSN